MKVLGNLSLAINQRIASKNFSEDKWVPILNEYFVLLHKIWIYKIWMFLHYFQKYIL